MKLLYIANIRLPTEKAHGVQIMKMCEAFANEGVSVELVVPTRKTSIREDPFMYYNVKNNFTVTRLPTVDTVSWGRIGFWLQTISFMVYALQYIRISSVDILYSRDPALFFFSNFKSIQKKVWEVHTKPTARILEKIKRLPITIVSISEGLKNVFVRAGIPENRIIVAHDAVDLEAFEHLPEKQQLRKELHLPLSKKLIAYVGKYKTMGESKGVEDIIVAVGKVHVEDPNTALLIVGLNSNEHSEVEHLVEKNGLQGNAYILGHVSQARIPHYLKAADILVMNYPNTEHYAHFMSPLKLFEYMASGVPIIASDLPSVREILDDDSALLIHPDIQSLVSSIFNLLRTVGSNYAQQAKNKVLVYTWSNRAKKILSNISL